MRFLIGLAAAFLLLAPVAANADWTRSDVKEFGFTAVFPVAPKREDSVDQGVKLTSYAAVANGSLCIVMHGLYPYVINPDVEIPASRDNFVKGISAQLGTQSPINFYRGTKKLRAHKFDANSETYMFRSILVIDGPIAYQVAGGVPRNGGVITDLDRCVNGFKLTPR
jgi:hypothetical protein